MSKKLLKIGNTSRTDFSRGNRNPADIQYLLQTEDTSRWSWIQVAGTRLYNLYAMHDLVKLGNAKYMVNAQLNYETGIGFSVLIVDALTVPITT